MQWFLIFPKQPSIFKIRFYGIDETGKPNGIDLCSAVLVKSDGSHIETIELSEKGVQMPKNGLAIAIEWIKMESNAYSDKYTGKDKDGKKYKDIHRYYAPRIGIIEPMDEKRTIYQLNYRNEWVCYEPLFEKGFKYSKLKLALTLSN